ncbi:hypothetical protein TrVE_jg1360 [Triparma verrucosa]|uniref:Uncharacterized protein n=1 Tax=Triparma verrucosa TaxID=1606542 RepID=A0A9W7KUY1_9STRA|nr:hypothetical protein TrVE_jg1360 [Triparma verrucosa]
MYFLSLSLLFLTAAIPKPIQAKSQSPPTIPPPPLPTKFQALSTSEYISTNPPPPLPTKFQALATSGYTSPGFFAGILDIAFTADCSNGPESQKLKSVYPDGYTVISDCSISTRYIIEPSSRGDTCAYTKIEEGEECDGICGAPFSVRDTSGVWTFGEDMEIVWGAKTSFTASDNSTITQHAGSVPRGAGTRLVFVNITEDDEVVSIRVESDDWFTVETTLENTTTTFDDNEFDAPSDCVPATDAILKSENSVSSSSSSSSFTTTATSPPSFPSAWSATLITSFTNPGYNAGNVFTNTTASCPSPPSQISRTTFGNFHTVQQDCNLGLIFDYDLQGLNCFVTKIGEGGVDRRICDTCTMPFGIRDTKEKGEKVWTFRGEESDRKEMDVVDWSPDGEEEEAWAGSADGGWMTVRVEVNAAGNYVRDTVEEHGWIRADVKIEDFKSLEEDNDLEEKFILPSCFDGMY